MKQYMKFGLAMTLALCLASWAQAQIGTPSIVVQQGTTNTAVTPGSSIWTNSINGYTSYTNMTAIDCRGKSRLDLQFTGYCSSNNATAGVKIWLFKSAYLAPISGSNCASATAYSPYVEAIGPSVIPYWSFSLPIASTDTGGAAGTSCTNLMFIGTTAMGQLPPFVYIGIISNTALGGANLTNYNIRAVLQ